MHGYIVTLTWPVLLIDQSACFVCLEQVLKHMFYSSLRVMTHGVTDVHAVRLWANCSALELCDTVHLASTHVPQDFADHL